MNDVEIINNIEVNDWLDEYISAENENVKKKLQNLIVVSYMPTVKRIARGMARRSTDPVEDIIQVGSLGLIKAIQQYDNQKSGSFKTYATYFISGEIKHYLRDKASMIKAPREILELAVRVSKLTNEIILELGNVPSEVEIAKKLNTSVEKVQEATFVDRRKTVSLDQVVLNNEDDGIALSERIVDDKYFEKQNIHEDNIMLKNAIAKLPENLKNAIELFYFEDLSQRAISKKLNISQMQVSRNLKKGLNMLFQIIKESEGE